VAPIYKTRLMSVGIRCAALATPSIRKAGKNFAARDRRSVSIVRWPNNIHGICFVCSCFLNCIVCVETRSADRTRDTVSKGNEKVTKRCYTHRRQGYVISLTTRLSEGINRDECDLTNLVLFVKNKESALKWKQCS
jgi:hypothetical protein